MSQRITAANIKIKVAGKEINANHITSVEVKSHLNQPDFALVNLANFGDSDDGGGGGGSAGDRVGSGVSSKRFSVTAKEGDDLEIMMGLEGEAPQLVFKGSITGTNPTFDTHLPATTTLHGMNALHKLSRGPKTRTFVNQKDQDIVSKIAQERGLSPNFGKTPPTLMHEHLHQWNQTDLEFLRLRAARTARNLWVDLDNKTLYYVKYEKDQGPVADLNYTEEGDSALENFAPQANSGAQVQKVEVRGWDPEKKQTIVGTYTAAPSSLGSNLGASAFGDSPVLKVSDVPVRTKEEADLVAESKGTERNMKYITGSATTKGNAKIKIGTIVKLTPEDQNYNGKYYVTGVTHTFSHGASGLGGGTGMGGFKTSFEFARDAGMGG